MADIKFPKKQEQRLIPKYLLEYATELNENHPDPSADWGASYTAGTGIDITGKVISNTYADVEANPTLAGNEDTLEGLEVDGVKYAVGGGKQLYQHEIVVSYNRSSSTCRGKRTVINSKAEAYTKDELKVMFGSGSVQAGVYGIVDTKALNSLEYRENTGQWHFYYSGSFVNTNDSNVTVSDTVTPC